MIANHKGASTAILTRHSNLGRRSAAVAVWRNADVFNVDILKPALGTGKAIRAAIPFDVEDAGSPVPSVFGEVCRHGSPFLTVGK